MFKRNESEQSNELVWLMSGLGTGSFPTLLSGLGTGLNETKMSQTDLSLKGQGWHTWGQV